MTFLERFFLVGSGIACIFLCLGLYKPWIMLWWAAVQNRRKIVRLYGSLGTFSYFVYSLIRALNS